MAYLLEVDDLHTFFKTKKGIVKAVNGVSYRVEPGKTLGIVGESGSGKSVSAMSILKLLDGNGYIDSGTITFKGRNLAECTINDMYQIRGNEISVIFQEPMTSLNPVYTIEKQLGTQREDEVEIDLGEIFHLMLSKLWLLILCFIVGATLAFGGTKFLVTPKYSASSMIYILTKTTSVTSLADIQMGSQLTADFEILATSRPVVEEVIEKLDLNYSYEQLVSMIATDNQTDTRILRFTVTDENAKEAKAIANELADATAERVAYVMASDKPKVVEEAVVPQNPSSPNTKKNTLLGGLGLAFVAAAIILIKYLMDDTIMTEEDVKKYLGIHMLAAIPEEKRR